MRKIGLIGGISWVSTIDYYRHINTIYNERTGGLEYPELLIFSFNYGDIKRNNDAGDWEKTLHMLSKASTDLIKAGAEAIVLCANTMHVIADDLQKMIDVPIIHIAEVTAKEIREQQIKKVALLGTKFTMEKDFFREKLKAQGIETIVPEDEDRDFIHSTIFEELGRGLVLPETKRRYIAIIEKIQARGAQGVILGCTEIPLLIQAQDIRLPAFDTTLLHSKAAVKFICSGAKELTEL